MSRRRARSRAIRDRGIKSSAGGGANRMSHHAQSFFPSAYVLIDHPAIKTIKGADGMRASCKVARSTVIKIEHLFAGESG